MELTSLIESVRNNEFSIAAAYLADLLAKGYLGAIGKDYWEKFKAKFGGTIEESTIKAFEDHPDDLRNQSKVELLFEQENSKDTNFVPDLIKLLENFYNIGNGCSQVTLKNLVINSSMNNIGGSINIGDRK